jgi:NADP-dependent 3-hydroxy acid dehydrogenase YdfG
MNIVIAAQPGNRPRRSFSARPAGEPLFLIATSPESFRHQFQHATIIGADLSSRAGISSALDAVVAHTSSIDVLINNVGVMVLKAFKDYSESDISSMLDTNLRSQILLTRAFLPLLQASSRPQIVFMSSMAAKFFIVGESVYSATKAGIMAFANVMRNELSGKVRVSTVHAWGVNTWGEPEPHDLMKPSDIADVVEFIITRPDTAVVESIDLGSPTQWRGGKAPWSPES